MNRDLDNLMLAGAQEHFERLTFATSAQADEIERHRSRFLASMDKGDLSGEIEGDVAENLIKLIQAEDANGAGRLLVSTMRAWADRLARRSL